MRRRLTPILVASAAALTLSACGAEDAAKKLDPVAEAAGKSISAGGADIDGRMTMELEGKPNEITFDGAIDFARSRMHMTMRASGALAREAKGAFPMTMAMSGTTMYQHMPILAKQLPGEKSWMKVDLEEITGGQMPSNFGSSDPGAIVESLKHAGETKRVGTEELDGEQTTRYRTMLDVKKIAAKQKMSPRVKQALEGMGDRKWPIDVWVDGEGRLRRQDMSFDAGGAKTRMTMVFENYRKNVEVEIPSDADAADMTDEIKKQMQQGG